MKLSLQDIGLRSEEERIIEILIQRQSANSMELMRETGLPKSTLFRFLTELKAKGVIVDDLKSRANKYRLSAPEALMNIVAKKRRQYRHMELSLQDLLDDLKYGTKKNNAQVEVHYTLEQFRELTEQSLFAKNKTMFDFGNIDVLQEIIGREYDLDVYMKERVRNKIFLYMLANESDFTRLHKNSDTKYLREMRFYPKQHTVESYWKTYDDTVIVYSNPKEKVVMRIKSHTIANLFRTMFHIMWEAVGK